MQRLSAAPKDSQYIFVECFINRHLNYSSAAHVYFSFKKQLYFELGERQKDVHAVMTTI